MANKPTNSTQSPYQSVLNQYSKSSSQLNSDSSLSSSPPPQSPPQLHQAPAKKPQLPPLNPATPSPNQPSSPNTKDPTPADAPFPAKDHSKTEQFLPNSSPSKTNSSQTSTKNPFKQVFFLSLFIFLVILGSIILSFFQQSQKPEQTIVATPTPIRNISPSPLPDNQNFCVLNDQQYQVSESFLSADGCNLCTCLPSLIISCTNNDCQE